MFDKFGEFDSVEELNKAAAGFKNEGDLESLKALAIENGLDPEDAEDFSSDMVPELATPAMAAIGKVKVQKEELKPQDIMADWVSYIEMRASEDADTARAVMKKGKNLKGCIAALLKWSFSHQRDVEKDILKAAGINASRVTLGIPGMGQAKKIISEYYLGA